MRRNMRALLASEVEGAAAWRTSRAKGSRPPMVEMTTDTAMVTVNCR